MSILEDEQRTLAIGAVAGVVAAGLVKFLWPAFSGAGRPLLKELIKKGLTTYESGRERFAQATELLEDLVAEARAELEAGPADQHAGGQSPVTAAGPRTNGGS